jgi:hypothetical protein
VEVDWREVEVDCLEVGGRLGWRKVERECKEYLNGCYLVYCWKVGESGVPGC